MHRVSSNSRRPQRTQDAERLDLMRISPGRASRRYAGSRSSPGQLLHDSLELAAFLVLSPFLYISAIPILHRAAKHCARNCRVVTSLRRGSLFRGSPRKVDPFLLDDGPPLSLARVLLTGLVTLALFAVSVLFLLLTFSSTIHAAYERIFHKLVLAATGPTLPISSEEITRAIRWEVASGHYPSYRSNGLPWPIDPISHSIALADNPALPGFILGFRPVDPENADLSTDPKRHHSNYTRVMGPGRHYTDVSKLHSPASPFPPRPKPQSVLDLDLVMAHCDFSHNRYVRDCLEVLRIAAGMDTTSVRFNAKADLSNWHLSYLPDWVFDVLKRWTVDFDKRDVPTHMNLPSGSRSPSSAASAKRDIDDNDSPSDDEPLPVKLSSSPSDANPLEGSFIDELPRHSFNDLNITALLLSNTFDRDILVRENEAFETPLKSSPASHSATELAPQAACDPTNPHVVHTLWAGPFTDKPYMTVLSWLFTQRLNLNAPVGNPPPNPLQCRPQLWMWLNPGPASSLPDENAHAKLMQALQDNPWSAPLLHPRFRDSVRFRLWNTSEQLDSITELSGWRSRQSLFTSGGVRYFTNLTHTDASKPGNDEKTRIGSTDANSGYDRLTTILSDMARFILTHRYGGIYVDADTLFLRDWEELFNYPGHFAYRWSRLPTYNTAMFKMRRQSPIGNIILRTAVDNDYDFHPMSVTTFLKKYSLEGLLLRLPDALFDSAWLNTEDFQLDRPAFPFFTSFDDFFAAGSAAPLTAGVDSFFPGAFAYHYHNHWWAPFDPARNYPDFGDRFDNDALRELRTKAQQRSLTRLAVNESLADAQQRAGVQVPPAPSFYLQDDADLSWATVLKRTFESFVRGERPNMYGEFIVWDDHTMW